MTRAPEYHNMSVPPFSSLTVGRAILPGPRFAIDLDLAEWRKGEARQASGVLERRLRRSGWRAAARLLGFAESGRGAARQRAQRDAVGEALAAALSKAGVPDRIGLFCPDVEPWAARLEPVACLAVLARRSGPLYLPKRAFEPSLVQVVPLTLVFPQEVHCAALG